MRVCGIMSGTSLDGIDVAVVDITGRGWKTRLEVCCHASELYPDEVRQAILGISNCVTHTAQISRINVLLGELYAESVKRVCERSGVGLDTLELIGCHGQTIFHEGEPAAIAGCRVASTLQIGDAATLAERTGVSVVSNFRARDMAAGGKGAPLVPYLDYLIFRDPRRGRVALNIGGIANLTAIAAGAEPEDVFAFDTGPGNMVMDSLVREATNGRHTFDRDGRLASEGSPVQALLNDLLSDSYYSASPPKTAGREQYDQLATAAAWTASTITMGIERFVMPKMKVDDVIVSGGGARNPVLMRLLEESLPETKILTSSAFGIDADAKEAIAFAVLAYETFHERPSNVPGATGASRPVVLGSITPGR